jgi:hypothetical protein
MKEINDNLSKSEILINGESRSVLDEECQQLGLPNIPEYVDAVDDFGEKRLLVLTVAGMHFLADKRLKDLPEGSQKIEVKRFKNFLNETIGKRGELKTFNNREGE